MSLLQPTKLLHNIVQPYAASKCSQVYPGVLALFKEITAERTMKQKEKVPKAPRSCLL